MLRMVSSWKRNRLRTPDAVADIEGGNIIELEHWNTVAVSGFTTSCSESDTRPPAHPGATGYLGLVLGNGGGG